MKQLSLSEKIKHILRSDWLQIKKFSSDLPYNLGNVVPTYICRYLHLQSIW